MNTLVNHDSPDAIPTVIWNTIKRIIILTLYRYYWRHREPFIGQEEKQTMSDEEKAIDTNVQATDHSTAIGKIEISGSVEGNVIIGGTYNITQGRTSETIQLPGISNTITPKYYEPETILIPEGQFC